MPEGNKLRVLVVEDEILIRKYIISILEDLDCLIAGETSTGEESITLARQIAPDLILMDIRLAGDIDGITAAKSISAISDIPVIFMSAYVKENDMEFETIRSFKGFLGKPVESHDLEPLIHIIKKESVNNEIA